MKQYILFLIVLAAVSLSAEPVMSWETDSGIKISILEESDSTKIVEKYDELTLHYEGWLFEGRKFDSTLDPGVPHTFMIGMGDMIKGMEEGLLGMRPGETRRLIIPPNLAYGEYWYKNVIPPNSTLDFKIKLLSVKKHPLNLKKNKSEEPEDSESGTQ